MYDEVNYNIEVVECPECGHWHMVDESGYTWGDCAWVKQQNYEHDDGPEGMAADLALLDYYISEEEEA